MTNLTDGAKEDSCGGSALNAGLGQLSDRKYTFTFQGVEYLTGTAYSLILACPKCGEEHFRDPKNYFWSLVPENKAWLERGQKNYWGDPSWHKCMTCSTQMEPIRIDELESRWRPFWRSLGYKLKKHPNKI